MTRLRTISRRAAVAAVLLAWAACPARADLLIEALSSTAQAGGTGGFDVIIQDTGGTFHVAGFSVELSVSPSSGVSFTAVDTNTSDSYLFGTLQSPPFTFDNFPNTSFTASDSDFTSAFVPLNPGDTFGLAHVSYSVLAGTPNGPVAVSLLDIGGGTSLSDDSGDAVSFTPVGGTITVQTVVPEPSALALVGVGGLVAYFSVRRTRSRLRTA
jgi:hypothetical protein